jgi:hypothetical protein
VEARLLLLIFKFTLVGHPCPCRLLQVLSRQPYNLLKLRTLVAVQAILTILNLFHQVFGTRFSCLLRYHSVQDSCLDRPHTCLHAQTSRCIYLYQVSECTGPLLAQIHGGLSGLSRGSKDKRAPDPLIYL